MTTVPGSLVWEIVKKNNSFLVEEFGYGSAKVQFSKESYNLYNVHSHKVSIAAFLTSGQMMKQFRMPCMCASCFDQVII